MLKQAVLGLLLVSAGCQEDGAPATSSVTSVAAPAPSAPGSAQSPTSAAPVFDAAAFCERVCERSATCGLARAEELARAGSSAERAAVAGATSERPGVKGACVERCTKAPPGPDDLERAGKADACVQQSSCAGFEQCLAALASPP